MAVSFDWEDPLALGAELAEDERMVRDSACRYAQERLMPRVRDAFRQERTDPAIFREMGALGLPAFVYSRYGYGRSDPLAAPRRPDTCMPMRCVRCRNYSISWASKIPFSSATATARRSR